MKIIRFIICFLALALCAPAAAEPPQPAYGVSVVGDPASCGSGVGLRCTNLGAHPYILLGGYYNPADQGGGYFALGVPGCTDNGGTVLKDSNGDCFYRTDSRAAVPVQWFGARCDAITTVVGGSATAGTATFTASSVTFQSGDVGKVIELDSKVGNPFRTTITGVVPNEPHSVTLNHAPYNNYPGHVGAIDARFQSTLLNGLDASGTGYRPGDTLSVTGGTHDGGQAAEVTVKGTSLVGFDPTSGGAGYQVDDLIIFTPTDTADYQIRPAVYQVTSVGTNGAVTGTAPVDYGNFATKGTTNPTQFAITSTRPSASGFAISQTTDQDFGVGSVKKITTQNGAYTALPPIPSDTSDMTTSGATGAQVDLTFPTPAWTYGTDDTIALANLESWLETDTNRGIYNAAEVPGGKSCLLQTLAINRPVTWRSSGSGQAQLLQVLGASGSRVDTSSPYGFVLVAAGYPANDTYQNNTVGQQEVGLDNISIIGGSTSTTVDVDGQPGIITQNNAGLLFQNPVEEGHTNVTGVLQNLQVANFPGNGLSAWHFWGELRGYNIFAGQSAGSCVDLEHTANPYRFYGLVAYGCAVGLNMVQSRTEEFHGASLFQNGIDVSITGTLGRRDSYVVFDNLQLGGADNEDVYLDQQNAVVICTSNCTFGAPGQACSSSDFACQSAIVIGPDAASTAGGLTPVIARFDQGFFTAPEAAYDFYFADSAAGTPCNCRVALGGGMFDAAVSNGTPTTNNPTLLTGQTTYAAPTFANGATVGVPLTLNPNELGIGVSSDTLIKPGAGGLKLRVECSTAHRGTARIVALAGSSNAETIIADGIGTCP